MDQQLITTLVSNGLGLLGGTAGVLGYVMTRQERQAQTQLTKAQAGQASATADLTEAQTDEIIQRVYDRLVERLEGEITRLQTRVAELEARLAHLEAELRARTAELAEVRAERDQLRAELEQARAKLAARERELEHLRAQLSKVG